MGCCADPNPRILEKNGRLFCNNCRRYLDKKTDGTDAAAVTASKTDEETKRAQSKQATH